MRTEATQARAHASPLLVAALVAGCSSPAPITTDAPEEVRWIAMAETDPDGTLTWMWTTDLTCEGHAFADPPLSARFPEGAP